MLECVRSFVNDFHSIYEDVKRVQKKVFAYWVFLIQSAAFSDEFGRVSNKRLGVYRFAFEKRLETPNNTIGFPVNKTSRFDVKRVKALLRVRA
jgi:hypothetical protein